MSLKIDAGARMRERFGWWRANQWLILRRATQLGFLALFLSGPVLGIWISKGTLAQSMTLETLPLTDPFILIQSLVAGHWPGVTAFTGAAIMVFAYLLAGGRAYCAWVCPVNPVTDAAAWIRRKMGLGKGWNPRRWTRRAIMLAVLAVSVLTGTLAWELINPVTGLHRTLVFGTGFGLSAATLIFLFDAFVARHGWCGHLCPVGAFYGLLGEGAVLRITASGRAACDDCMDCYAVCPEPQVITPALRGRTTGHGPLILSGDCLNCARCIDVCSEQVFRFTHRFDKSLDDGKVPSRAPLYG
jgi:ferredoxin-type protein NapH